MALPNKGYGRLWNQACYFISIIYWHTTMSLFYCHFIFCISLCQWYFFFSCYKLMFIPIFLASSVGYSLHLLQKRMYKKTTTTTTIKTILYLNCMLSADTEWRRGCDGAHIFLNNTTETGALFRDAVVILLGVKTIKDICTASLVQEHGGGGGGGSSSGSRVTVFKLFLGQRWESPLC